MRRYLLYIAQLLLTIVLAASCQKEQGTQQPTKAIEFSLSTADSWTKAAGDESAVTHLHYEVYEVVQGVIQESPVIDEVVAFDSGSQSISVTLELVLYQHYKIIFWADHADSDGKSLHYITDDLREISFRADSPILCNDASREAYYTAVNVENILDITADDTKISLIRPFAQLNIGNSGTATVSSSAVSISGLSDSFDTLSGVGGAAAEISFASAATISGESITVDQTSYPLVAMCYAFVPQGEANAKVSYTLIYDAGEHSGSIDAVPFRSNYRSNIVGELANTQ